MSVWTERRPGLADALTLGNAMCGVVAMLVAAGLGPAASLSGDGRYRAAALLLVLGTLFDVLDGAVARLRGGTPLGPPLDCLADGISFGVAPVVIVVAAGVPALSAPEWSAITIAALAYVVAALIRLADFATRREQPTGFVGLPTTSACVAAISLGFLHLSPLVLAAGMATLAVMMVSSLAYPTGTQVVALPILGWTLGTIGIVGLVDVRVCSALTLVIVCVLVPLRSSRQASPTGRPT